MEQRGDTTEKKRHRTCDEEGGDNRAADRLTYRGGEEREFVEDDETECGGDPDANHQRSNDRKRLKDPHQSVVEGEGANHSKEDEGERQRNPCGER